MRQPRAFVAALALLVILPACGDSGNTPDEPTRTRIAAGSFNVVGTVEAAESGLLVDIASGPFTVLEGGTLEIVADWQSADNNIDIFFFLGQCTSAQAVRGDCTLANRSTGTATKPERLSIIGVPPGNYSVGLANFGTTRESGTFEVFLNR